MIPLLEYTYTKFLFMSYSVLPIDMVCVFIQQLLGLITIKASPLPPGQFFQPWQR